MISFCFAMCCATKLTQNVNCPSIGLTRLAECIAVRCARKRRFSAAYLRQPISLSERSGPHAWAVLFCVAVADEAIE